jgi:Domain of unknown function (DUF4386)
MTDLKKTARATGLWYLGLLISGAVGYMAIRGQLYVADDAAATAANLVEHESLARAGIAADMAIVVTQALAALYFYKFLRSVNAFAAGALAAFGLINAMAILVGVALSATALDVALTGGSADTAQLLYNLSDAMWGVGALFFGLWLIPMGYVVYTARLMPRALGAILVVGGATYLLSAFVLYLWPDAPGAVAGVMTTLPAIGEFWIIGYLLTFGVRAPETTRQAVA